MQRCSEHSVVGSRLVERSAVVRSTERKATESEGIECWLLVAEHSHIGRRSGEEGTACVLIATF